MSVETELVDDGRGGLVASGKATDEDEKKKPEDEAEATADEKALPGAAPAPGDAPPAPSKDEEEDDEEKEKAPPAPPFGGDKSDEAKKAIGDAASQLNSVVEAFKTAGIEVDAETQAKLDAATTALEGLSGAFAPAEKTFDRDLPGGTDAIDTLKSAGADAATLSALNALLGKSDGSIEKAGARMAKERLERFRKAMELLQTLLKEFLPADFAKSAGGSGSLLSSIDSSFVAGFARNAKADPELVKKLNQLTELVEKRFSNQDTRIDKISKAAGGSNVIPLETKPSQQTVEEHWPLDMNRPITRESVDKSVSFFDVE